MANNLPKHIDKITDPKRKAVAPYNFVELPDKVVEAQALPCLLYTSDAADE